MTAKSEVIVEWLKWVIIPFIIIIIVAVLFTEV